MRTPLGAILWGDDVLDILPRANKVATVGDFCTVDLISRGRIPDVAVVDYRTQRREYTRHRNDLKKVGFRFHPLKNPPGRISREAWGLIAEAFKSQAPVCLEITGEEDLLTLPVIALAPVRALVLYGMPDKGVVAVSVDAGVRKKVHTLLELMEPTDGN